MRADRAARLERSSDWEHVDLEDRRILVRLRRVEQWFGPDLPDDATLEHDRSHLAPLAECPS